MIFDFSVIGLGTAGSFGAYYAAKAGLNVCGIDKFSPIHTNGSYHGDTRIFRIAYGEGAKYIPLLQRSYELWGKFEKDCNKVLFNRNGLLNIGSKNNEFMQNIEKSVSEYDLEVKHLSAAQIYSDYGIKVSDEFYGVLETQTGFTKSDESVLSAWQGAKKFGAAEKIGDIERIIKENGIYKIYFNDEVIETKQILISAGSFVDEILSKIEFDFPKFPIEVKRKVVHWYQTNNNYQISKNKLSSFIIEHENDHYYGFFDYGEGLKIGRDQSGQYISKREERTPFGTHEEDFSEIQDHLKTYFPNIGEFIKGSVCTYPLAPDNDFILDFLDENVFIIAGLSHGFKFAPALGELGVKALKAGKVDENISKYFSISRFKQL